MIYSYTSLGQVAAQYYDWIDVKYDYHSESGVLRSIRLTNRIMFNFTCNMRYNPPGALVKVIVIVTGVANVWGDGINAARLCTHTYFYIY